MDHQVNVILRRDEVLESIHDTYRNTIFPDDNDKSSCSSSVFTPRPTGRPIAGPFNPFDQRTCDNFHHSIEMGKSESKPQPVVTKVEIKPQSSKFKYILLSVIVLCGAVTAVFSVLYVFNPSPTKITAFIHNDEVARRASYDYAFPESHRVFASNSDERSDDDVPVFLDLGTESDNISSALTKCLRLTRNSIFGNKEQKTPKKQTDFIYTNSLCSLSNNIHKNRKGRVFILARNPSTRSILSYREKQDMTGSLFDERALGLDFTSYLQSPLQEKDSLTRAILCKENKELTNEDYAAAQHFLENYATYGVFKDYKKAFIKFSETFKWNFQSDVAQKCVDDVFHRVARQTDRLIVGMRMIELYNLAEEANKFDSRLYSHMVSRN